MFKKVNVPLSSKRRFLLYSFVLGLGLGPAAYAEEGEEGEVSREAILEEIKMGMTAEEITDKYAERIGILAEGASDTSWERMTSCGYQPQRKEATCRIEIRQQFGYGGPPPGGGTQFVQLCVDYGNGEGLVPVNVNGVNVHDEVFGERPPWSFSAVIPADERLFSQLLDGRTLAARTILSWEISPGGNCEFIPAFGNRLDFRIRLDAPPVPGV
jgi:hypothetical protein